MFALDNPARCMTARRGRDGASSDQNATQDPISAEETTPLISAESSGCIGVFIASDGSATEAGVTSTLTLDANRPARTMPVALGPVPRRLTPREHERCFGFPDDYTLVDGSSDSTRYEALGNSMAVPVMKWLGERILAVEAILRRVKG